MHKAHKEVNKMTEIEKEYCDTCGEDTINIYKDGCFPVYCAKCKQPKY